MNSPYFPICSKYWLLPCGVARSFRFIPLLWYKIKSFSSNLLQYVFFFLTLHMEQTSV